MAVSFDPVAELRSHGLVGESVPQPAGEKLANLSKSQVDTFIRVKDRVDALESADVQAHDGELALAMARAIGWDKPAAQELDGDVEAMSMSTPECACLCSTASGGGGGQSLQ